MLIWTDFNSFAISFHFPRESVINSLQTQKGLKLVFKPQLL